MSWPSWSPSWAGSVPGPRRSAATSTATRPHGGRRTPTSNRGPALRRVWDRRAWAQARPDKVVPTDGAALVERWNEELHALGYRDPAQVGLPIVVGAPRVGSVDRDAVGDVVLSRLGARRSAWNAADIRGEVEQWIAATGLVADAAVRIDLAEDLTARVLGACGPLLRRDDVPEHIRALTSPAVLAVEAEIVTRLIGRAEQPADHTRLADPDRAAGKGTLDVAQRSAVAALGGDAALLVVEGAAGAGKTTTLSATRALLAEQAHRMVVVTPTLKAAKVAGRETGAGAYSAAWLAHQHGWRWDEDGRWTRQSSTPAPEAVLRPGDLLVVDEAGMLDQDTARALLTIADETLGAGRVPRRPTPTPRRRPRRRTRPRSALGTPRTSRVPRRGAPVQRPAVRRDQPRHAHRNVPACRHESQW